MLAVQTYSRELLPKRVAEVSLKPCRRWGQSHTAARSGQGVWVLCHGIWSSTCSWARRRVDNERQLVVRETQWLFEEASPTSLDMQGDVRSGIPERAGREMRRAPLTLGRSGVAVESGQQVERLGAGAAG